MTLIITAGCKDFVVQVSDRRFTMTDKKGERPLTDEGNKEVVVRGYDADLAVSFTGLGVIDGKPVGDCIIAWIEEYTNAEASFNEYVDSIRKAAEETFVRLFKQDQTVPPLTFVLGGFIHGHKRPTLVTVSNCQSEDYRVAEPVVDFAAHRGPAGDSPYYAAGYLPALPKDSKAKIKHLLRSTPSYPQVTDLIVQEIRRAAQHSKHGKYVGAECTSICIFKNGEAESVYHPTHMNPVTYGPNLVDVIKQESGAVGRMFFSGMAVGGAMGMSFSAGSSRGGLRIKDRRALFSSN